MSIEEIETHLSNKNDNLNNDIFDKIEQLRLESISKQDEQEANYFWCLRQIYIIKKSFLLAIDDLRTGNYEDAWLTFDDIDIELGDLEKNFDICQENDKYNLSFIGRIIKEYQKLFPYCLFLSRETVIKSEKCSICDQVVSLRHSCGHKVGKLYMGELCGRVVTDIEFKAIAVVTDPFDKYAYIKMEGKEYDYSCLEQLMSIIHNPYDDFHVEITKIKNPKYNNVEKDDTCPCGSNEQYKNCHLGTQEELMNHYIVHIKIV